ncbi:MAG: hypothetical protein KBS59_03155 [Clostridiales bacterium]|nr:hypothetical protein [Clostridiales bacterium]
MALEPKGYRQALERLVDIFPERAAIGIEEASRALGMDRRVLLGCESFPAKRIGKKYVIVLTELAIWMVKS